MSVIVTAVEREERARQALAEITAAGTFGDLLTETAEGDGVFTLLFAATMAGYPGWHWTVSLAELDGEQPSVLETELMPGDGALLAPDWVPWSERLDEYRAAQAEAGEAVLDEGVDEELDDELDDDDLDDDDHDDLLDEPDDGIDFEALGDSSALLAVGEDEQDEAEADSDDGSPEPPVTSAF